MKQIDIGKIGLNASEISLGCMRMADLSLKEAAALINTALDAGIDFFDHADMVGESRRKFLRKRLA